MKRLLFAAIAVLLSVTTLSAAQKKGVVEQQSLPKSAQTFITTHYPKDKISTVSGTKEYKVVLASGVKIEFDKKGEWTEVESKRNNEVPKAIVPTQVKKYVNKNYSSKKIVKIERDSKSTEVELSNGIDLKFNSKGELIDIDR